jgi:hypothetical protein
MLGLNQVLSRMSNASPMDWLIWIGCLNLGAFVLMHVLGRRRSP